MADMWRVTVSVEKVPSDRRRSPEPIDSVEFVSTNRAEVMDWFDSASGPIVDRNREDREALMRSLGLDSE